MPRTGYKARVYVAGKIVPGVQDITVTTSRTEVQVKVREHGDVRYLAGLKDTPIDFEMLDDPTDETYLALKAAYHSDTDDNFLEVEITDNPKTAAKWEGIKGDFIVTKFEKSYPVDDAAKVNVSLRQAAASKKAMVETRSS
jgi:hypothetical protein